MPMPMPIDGDAADADAGRVPQWLTTTRPDVAAHITVTVSLETLLGLTDRPGDLAGYGAITAQLARDLATDGIWRCVAVDDTHGTVLGVGRTTYTPAYTPGRALRAFISVAAPVCSVPHCTTPAARCDIDHHTPYAQGGATCSCSCGPLCRRHHRLKSAGYLLVEPSTDPPPPTRDHHLDHPHRTPIHRPAPHTPTTRTGHHCEPAAVLMRCRCR